MKNYHEGKLYGGIALIALGAIVLIENVESLPFFVCLLIVGVGLIFYSFKKPSNAQLFLNKCKEFIQKYEKNLPLGIPSCENIIFDIVYKNKKQIKSKVKNIKEDEKIEKICNTFLTNLTFNLLSSGQYHIYYGELGFQGNALLAVYNGASKWLLDNNYITQETYDNKKIELRENIKTIG